MKLSALVLSSLLFVTVAHAGVFGLETGDRKIENVNIATSAAITTGSETQKLELLGAGLRAKKVLVTNVKVYVTQVFVDDASKFDRSSTAAALASLDNMKAGAIRLTFLRDVDAGTVQVSFRDALEANNVDINEQGVASFLNAVKDGADAQNGKSMNMSLTKLEDGTVQVVYENTKGEEETVVGDAKLFTAIFSIWLGTPADSGLATLQKALLKGLN